MYESEKEVSFLKTNKQRLITAFICAVIIFVPFLSSIYIVSEANHDCTGADCPICACIQQYEHQLKQLGTGKTVKTAAAAAEFFVVAVVFFVLYTASFTTLVTQKVRLND